MTIIESAQKMTHSTSKKKWNGKVGFVSSLVDCFTRDSLETDNPLCDFIVCIRLYFDTKLHIVLKMLMHILTDYWKSWAPVWVD